MGGDEDKEDEGMDGSDSGSDELHLGGQVRRQKYVYGRCCCGTWHRVKSALQMIIPGGALGGTR